MAANRDGQTKESKKQQSKPAQEPKSSQVPAGAIPDYAGLTGDPRLLDAMVADSRQTTIQGQESATQINHGLIDHSGDLLPVEFENFHVLAHKQ
jgi:hypothetical protein